MKLNGCVSITNEEDPSIKIQIATGIIIGILIFFSLIGTAEGKYVGAYGVKITEDYVHVDYAKCTCIHSDGYYYHKNETFINYCPICKSRGNLNYERGKCSQNKEGMWYCTRCDADYCLVHGTEHSYNPKGYLIRYKPKPKSNVTPKPDKKTIILLQLKEYINTPFCWK